MNPFQTIGSRRPESSQFDLSHTRKFSFSPGFLYPILCAEAIPSDVFTYDANAVVRMAPMLSPIMHMVDVCVHSFFYPERLTMARGNFETFITGGQLGDGKNANGDTIDPPYFFVQNDGASGPTSFRLSEWFGPSSLADFLGMQYHIGAAGTTSTRINARPFIAFWRIYCEYFRDQNVDPDWVTLYPDIFDAPAGGNVTSAIYTAMTTGGPNLFTFFTLPRVCWEKDYFTSALPFAQRGEAVEAPLSGTAVINYKTQSDVLTSAGVPVVGGYPLEGGNPPDAGLFIGAPLDVAARIENIDNVALATGGFSIAALRTAARLQEWLEKMATGGARYIEQIKAQFGVTSSDARLQRAEYLGGGKIPMHISEVVQSAPDGATPLAEMAGHGVTAGQITNFKKFVEEHGYFMVFIYLRPKTSYQQGLPRMFWNRFDKLDYAWPSFARIGEQEVLTKELYFNAVLADDNEVFGYQQRYAEYKYIPSTVHGLFQTDLSHWHWGRIFGGAAPTLSPDFVHCDPSDRIFNVLGAEYDSLYCIVQNRITARRPLPYYGEPHL